MMTATPREAQVLALRQQGLSVKHTAVMLGVSTGTVKIHIKNLFAKGLAHPKPRPSGWSGAKLDALLAAMEDSLSRCEMPQPSLEGWIESLRECKS